MGLVDKNRIYKSSSDEKIKILGKDYKLPKEFIYGEWTLVASLPKIKDCPGFPVEIYECRMPARLFKIRALDYLDSMNGSRKGFILSTGSIDQELVGRMALEINNGYLSAKDDDGTLSKAAKVVDIESTTPQQITSSNPGGSFCPMHECFNCGCGAC